MHRTTRSLVLASGALTLVAGACGGGESGQEAALERLIEAETGEDIDLDLDGDGGFSVQTEDGEVTIDSEGNVVFSSEDGSGVFDSDGDGGGTLTFEDADGEQGSIDIDSSDGDITIDGGDGEVGSIDIDGDDGTFTFEGEDGEVIVADVDEDDGTVVVQGEDGEATFSSGPGIPEQWPSDIPVPEGLQDATNTFMGDGASMNIFVAGSPSGDPLAYVEAYVAQLVGAGFTETFSFSNEDGTSYSHDRDGVTVAVNYTDLGGDNQVVVSISQF